LACVSSATYLPPVFHHYVWTPAVTVPSLNVVGCLLPVLSFRRWRGWRTVPLCHRLFFCRYTPWDGTFFPVLYSRYRPGLLVGVICPLCSCLGGHRVCRAISIERHSESAEQLVGGADVRVCMIMCLPISPPNLEILKRCIENDLNFYLLLMLPVFRNRLK